MTERVRALLDRLGLPTRLADGPSVEQIMSTIELDKEHRSGGVRWVLLEGVSRPLIRGDVLIEVAQEVCARAVQ